MSFRFNRKQAIVLTILFTAIQLAVMVAFYLLAAFMISTAECPSYPGDPCDAAPMLGLSLMMVSVPVALFLGVIGTYAIYYRYMKK